MLDGLQFLAVPEINTAGVVFQLEGEGAVSPILRQRGMALGGGALLRAGLAEDLAAADAVVLVEEDVGMLRTVPVGAEGDQQLRRGRLLGRGHARKERYAQGHSQET